MVNKKWLVLPGALVAISSCGACSLENIPNPKDPTVVTQPATRTTVPECTYQENTPYDTLSVQPDSSQSGLWRVYVGGHTGAIGTVYAISSSDALAKAFDVEVQVCTAIVPNGTTQGVPPYSGNSGVAGSTGSTGNTGNSG